MMLYSISKHKIVSNWSNSTFFLIIILSYKECRVFSAFDHMRQKVTFPQKSFVLKIEAFNGHQNEHKKRKKGKKQISITAKKFMVKN